LLRRFVFILMSCGVSRSSCVLRVRLLLFFLSTPPPLSLFPPRPPRSVCLSLSQLQNTTARCSPCSGTRSRGIWSSRGISCAQKRGAREETTGSLSAPAITTTAKQGPQEAQKPQQEHQRSLTCPS
jgi:hypothetical protein